MFTIRKMKPEDKENVKKLCSNIWDGDDYVPHVFDWVKDEIGEFTAVEHEGELIGLSKLFLTPTDAWVEGLRKNQIAK